jgi:hypothetical protein
VATVVLPLHGSAAHHRVGRCHNVLPAQLLVLHSLSDVNQIGQAAATCCG